MLAMAQLDNPNGRPFTVGDAQRDWLKNDLAKVKPETPVIVFSHSPLYKIYKAWNFWTDDAEEVQKLLAPFKSVTVIHGHTHQMLSNRIGNIHFHGMLSTAWPWPYAPQGLPKLTVRMNRADPFDEFDGCGDGSIDVLKAGHVDKNYNLWSRNPVKVSAAYLALRRRGRPARRARPTSTTRARGPSMTTITTRSVLLCAASRCGARAAPCAARCTSDDADGRSRSATARRVMTIPGLKPGDDAAAGRARRRWPAEMMQVWREERRARCAGRRGRPRPPRRRRRRPLPAERRRPLQPRRPADEVHRARPDALEARGEEVDRRGLQGLPQRQGARRHHRHLVRHVPSRRAATRIRRRTRSSSRRPRRSRCCAT